MKAFVVFAALVALTVAKSVPLVPRDNSHYVEGESRYVWMPDGEGNPVLVDLEEPVNQQVLDNSARNGANNQYWLFTRQNPTSRQVLVHNNINSVWNSNYRNTRGLAVIVHGWNSDGNHRMNPLIRDAFLAVADVNVIVVDWGMLANEGYTTAMSGVPSVGQHLGNFLVWLINNAGGNWNNVHLVGFSLGAHAVGNAGRQTGGRPSRVTGLDPAGFLWHSNSNRLQPNAGRYVEAIHTDGGLLGIMNPSGHADFYPNGGRNRQPGCSNSNCSHSRAVDLFASTIRNNRFVGRRCNNINEAQNNNCSGANLNMGNAIFNKSGTGLYALTTGAAWPF
ncbi:pancreatic triacylglycerol lipase-like [Ostrinia furnacalis]|uniref:pancreatic triacylglycerol lipase-like n=1 Tax=Ostrinia furnacalis TaxID=93504 RepID=UPI0010392F97|nr:pancreatic triacylglycerol lipase-like [Ostrinia furnacalis]